MEVHGKITTHEDLVNLKIDKVISALDQILVEDVETLYVEIEVVYTNESQGGIEVLRFDTTGWHGE